MKCYFLTSGLLEVEFKILIHEQQMLICVIFSKWVLRVIVLIFMNGTQGYTLI